MSKVFFPLFDLELTIKQVAFSVFGIDIYWYAILMVSAMIIGILILKKRDGLYNIKFLDIIDLLVYLIPISILSARLYYILFDLNHFIKSPLQILNFRTGGMAIYGGIIGGVITSIVFCKNRKIKILDLLDYLAPALALRTGDWKVGKLYKC
jgi:phosphatidylglycerol:prolipoprotein diacylglycerol transferase